MVIKSPYANTLIRQYTLTALSKFAIRLNEASVPDTMKRVEKIRDILGRYAESQDLELQQRSVEYEALFTKGDLVNGVLEHMPAPEIRATIMGTGTASFLPVELAGLLLKHWHNRQFLRSAMSARRAQTPIPWWILWAMPRAIRELPLEQDRMWMRMIFWQTYSEDRSNQLRKADQSRTPIRLTI